MLHFPDILGVEGGLFWLGGVQFLPDQTMSEMFYLFIYLIIQKHNVCHTYMSELWHMKELKEQALLLPALPQISPNAGCMVWPNNVEAAVPSPYLLTL